MRWKWGWNGSDIDSQHARAAFEVPRRRRPDGAGAGDRAEPAARPGAGPPLLAFPRADRRSRSGRRDRADQGGRQVRRRTRTRPRCVRRPDDRRRAPPSSSAARLGRDGDVRRGRRVARGLRVRARAQRDPVGVAGRVRSLTRRERQVVALRFYRDLTQQDIADRLALSQAQVSRTLSTALAKLRSALVEQ